jgi:argininosuccinate synthase
LTNRPRIVLAYSGDADATASLAWLVANRDADVITTTIDVGQGGPLDEIRQRALSAGAARAHVLDLRDTFAEEFVLRALHAGALDAAGLTLAPVAPLVARTLVEIAGIEQAEAVAHASRGTGDAETPMDRLLRALDSDLTVIAPLRGSARTVTPPSASVRAGSGAPATIGLAFERGVPVAVNGVTMTLAELIDSLETIAGVRGTVVLQTAHSGLEREVLPPDLVALKRQLAASYAELIRTGSWFTPTREALDAFVQATQAHVTGVVRVEVSNGECTWQTIAPGVIESRDATHWQASPR